VTDRATTDCPGELPGAGALAAQRPRHGELVAAVVGRALPVSAIGTQVIDASRHARHRGLAVRTSDKAASSSASGASLLMTASQASLARRHFGLAARVRSVGVLGWWAYADPRLSADGLVTLLSGRGWRTGVAVRWRLGRRNHQ
jgi:hypothetical protein